MGKSNEYKYEYKQIMPANGWRVVYAQNDGTITSEPLMAWVLVEFTMGNHRFQSVEGLVPEGVNGIMVFHIGNAIGYAAPGEDTESEQWMRLAAEHRTTH